MRLRRENYYPLGKCVFICIAVCCASFIYGQGDEKECSIRVKQEIRVNSMERQANFASQTFFNYYQNWQLEKTAFGTGNLNTTVELVPFKTSEMLYISNFGFQVPEDSYIEGIVVNVQGKREGDGYIKERAVRLLNEKGEFTGNNKAGKAYYSTEWDTLGSTWKYGTEIDDWDASPTTEMINSKAFGLALQIRNGASSDDVKALIESVSIEVYFTEIFRFCDGDCVSFSAIDNPDIVSYLWRLPGEFELLSISEKADIINVGQADATYGKYEICVDLTDKYDFTYTCCRPFIFEECVTPNLGDRIWIDLNANGNQDSNEPGIEGVTIELYTSDGAYIDETISDSQGNYLFTDLNEDDYYIRVERPEGFLFTYAHAGDEDKDSDIDDSFGPGTSELIGLFGADNLNIDIGLAEELIIGDMVWEDCNGDGIRSNDEKGIEGVMISLYSESGILLDALISDSLGQYFFDQLHVGTYSLLFEVPDTLEVTISNSGNPGEDSDIDQNGNTGLILFSKAGLQDSIDAGYVKLGSTGDFVWLDENTNGIQDQDEKGKEGVEINLLNDKNEQLQSIIIGPDGKYNFANIFPGEYIIEATPPEGYEATGFQIGQDSTMDSDLEGGEGIYYSTSFAIKSGQHRDDIDLGFIPLPGTIEGIAWYDENVNGIYNESEPFFQGVIVSLLDTSGTELLTTVTDETGNYSFEEIEIGTYSISFSLNEELLFTLSNEGSDEAIDSDASNNGHTDPIIITPGLDTTGINAGYIIPASVGDYVWLDNDRDGKQDENEDGIDSIQISLIDNDGLIVSSTNTNQNGRYKFDLIFPGEYSIEIEGVGDLIPTNEYVGDTTLDSDLSVDGDKLVINFDPLGYSEDNNSIDAGLMYPGGDIIGVIWNDQNLDGIRQEEEELMSDLQIQLIDDSSEIVATTTSDNEGKYSFISIEEGDYVVVIDAEDDYTITIPGVGDEETDSDFLEEEDVISTTVLIVVEGQVLENIDAGLVELSEISGLVWEEINIDGVKDPDETGFTDVTVTLFNSDDEEIQSILSDQEDGTYSFEKVQPGEYYVVFSIPEDYRFTKANEGDDEAIDSDVTGAFGDGSTDQIIVPGDVENLNGGLVEIGNINGLVWRDINGNGLRDENESTIEGLAVILFSDEGIEIESTTTGLEGTYIFEGNDKGEYYVQFIVEDGLVATASDIGIDDSIDSDVTGDNGPFTTSTFTLDKNGAFSIDLGLLEFGEINGMVWIDGNLNGLIEEGEGLLSEVHVLIYDTQGILIAETSTDVNGSYDVEVLSGDYYVVFGVSDDYIPTLVNIGNDDALDSDVTGMYSLWSTDTISVPESGTNINAGLIELSDIMGLVWSDVNGNGIREEGESRRNGVNVFLYDKDGNVLAETISENNGESDGIYVISGVVPADYYVGFGEVEGTIATLADQGNNDDLDSDVTGANGSLTTDLFNVSGQDIKLDLGLRTLAEISGRVWLDANENGLRDQEEQGQNGVGVYLYNESGVLQSQDTTVTIEGISGLYQFIDIPAGNYYVEFEVAEGFLATDPDAGDETIDSDVTAANGAFTTSTFLLTDDGVKNLDLGIVEEVKYGNISGLVWIDSNEDGLRDVVESGQNAILVNLYDESGIFQSQDTTTGREGIDGTYQFEGIVIGNYYVEFEVDEGLLPTTADVGDETIDSDVTGANGDFTTSTFLLTEIGVEHIDLGLVEVKKFGSITGLVWIDTDEDGLRGEGESGQNAIVVNLYNEFGILQRQDTTVTKEEIVGTYEFVDMEIGNYYVEFEIEEGFIPTIPNAGSDIFDSDVTGENGPATTLTFLLSEAGVIHLDLGLVEEKKFGGITGLVWLDTNEDGLRGEGELGQNDIVVNLYTELGILHSQDTTFTKEGVEGIYQFDEIELGNYYIEFEVGEGFLATTPDAGNEAIDSDVNGANGAFTTPTFSLIEASVIHLDLGLVEAMEFGSISGLVWLDANENGLRDEGEPGKNEVNVKLINASGDVVAQAFTRDINGIAGSYQFTVVLTGVYHVVFETDEGFMSTIPDAGSDDTIDSDVTGDNGPFTTSLFTLTVDGIENLDLGLIEKSEVTGNISGVVWIEEDNDGVREDGETGNNGVNVILFNNDGIEVVRTVTSTLDEQEGVYSFSDVAVGDYYIMFQIEDGIIVVPANAGDDDTIDSDVTGDNGPLTTSTFALLEEGRSNIDLGLVIPEEISGRIWIDTNANGLRDNEESGRNGIMVILYDDQGIEVERTTTAILNGESGSYGFLNILPGTYYLQFEVMGNLVATTPNVGEDDTIDSDVTELMGPYTTSLIVVPGMELDHIDLGLLEPSNISGIVWRDDNGDGLRNGEESGLNEIEVVLFDDNDQEVARTTTIEISGLTGSYIFEDIGIGNYYVQFEIVGSFVAADPNVGDDDSIDSDVTGNNGPFTTNTFALTQEGIQHLDLGIVEGGAGGMISGRVWEDLDGDGIRESGEEVGSDLTVRLRTIGGSLVAITTTAGNGTYMFMDIPVGNYYVEFSVPSENHEATLPLVGEGAFDSDVTGDNGAYTTYSISIASGGSYNNIDFGYFKSASLGDFVWDDVNANGLFDEGEPGINDIAVKLYNTSGEEIANSVTQNNGNEMAGYYLLENIPPGLYYLKFSLPPGAGFTVPDAGSNSLDSDVTNANGEGSTDVFEVFSDDEETSYDAGLVFGSAMIGDFVWLDLDADGIQDVNEDGMNGIRVTIFAEGGALINSTLSSQSIEGQDGYYAFAGLDPGNYYIVAELPDTLVFTTPDSGADNLDSDVTGSIEEGSTDLIPILFESNTDIDIGLYGPGSIGDYVWEDINKNGIQDDGEPGIKDVEVILFTSMGEEVTSTFTDIQGNYTLADIKPGLYFIEFLLPSSEFVFTEEHAGMDDTIDSDVDAAGVTSIISVTNASLNYNVDAGIYNANTLIGGIIWMDENGDGVRNENNLLEGVLINLLDENEKVLQSTKTNFAGRYAFTNVDPGRYYIEVQPENSLFEFSQPGMGIDGGLDSDVGVDGRSALIKIDPGNDPIRIDAGITVGDQLSENNKVFLNQPIDKIKINAYPSLTSGRVNINLTNTEGEVRIMVFDRSGRLVDTVNRIYADGISINLEHLHQGPYYIKAATARGTVTTQIIKL